MNALSHFLLLDANMAYDVSSDVLEQFGQCGSTSFGSLFEHCTSAPLWVDECLGKCNIHCPLDGIFTLTWGRGGGYSDRKGTWTSKVSCRKGTCTSKKRSRT